YGAGAHPVRPRPGKGRRPRSGPLPLRILQLPRGARRRGEAVSGRERPGQRPAGSPPHLCPALQSARRRLEPVRRDAGHRFATSRIGPPAQMVPLSIRWTRTLALLPEISRSLHSLPDSARHLHAGGFPVRTNWIPACTSRRRVPPIVSLRIAALLVLGGCRASTQNVVTYGERLPRPQLIVVHDFTAMPGDAKLESGLLGRVEQEVKAMEGQSL